MTTGVLVAMRRVKAPAHASRGKRDVVFMRNPPTPGLKTGATAGPPTPGLKTRPPSRRVRLKADTTLPYYRAEQGVGFQAVAFGSFLKSELVR